MNMIWNDWSVHVLLSKAAGQILPVLWKCFGHVWPSCIQFQSSRMYDTYIDIVDIISVYMIRNTKIDYTRVCNISTRGTSCPSPRWEDGLLTEHRFILQKASWEFLLDPVGMNFGSSDVLSFYAWLFQCTNFLVLVEVDEGIRGEIIACVRFIILTVNRMVIWPRNCISLSFLLFILVHSIQKDTGQSSTFLAAGACDEIQTHPIKSERVEGGERMVNMGDLLDPVLRVDGFQSVYQSVYIMKLHVSTLL